MAHAESFDLAHLGAVELYTPKFEESLHFFRDICAMRVYAACAACSPAYSWLSLLIADA